MGYERTYILMRIISNVLVLGLGGGFTGANCIS